VSWWVYLQDLKGNNVRVDTFSEGGTYVLGGSDEAELNITYNYGLFYRQHLDREEGLRWLDGKKARKAIKRLEAAVAALGTEREGSYWDSNPGNAGYALNVLLTWAKEHPKAVFIVH